MLKRPVIIGLAVCAALFAAALYDLNRTLQRALRLPEAAD